MAAYLACATLRVTVCYVCSTIYHLCVIMHALIFTGYSLYFGFHYSLCVVHLFIVHHLPLASCHLLLLVEYSVSTTSGWFVICKLSCVMRIILHPLSFTILHYQPSAVYLQPSNTNLLYGVRVMCYPCTLHDKSLIIPYQIPIVCHVLQVPYLCLFVIADYVLSLRFL